MGEDCLDYEYVHTSSGMFILVKHQHDPCYTDSSFLKYLLCLAISIKNNISGFKHNDEMED